LRMTYAFSGVNVMSSRALSIALVWGILGFSCQS
jgi:hypothetical protein